MVRWTCVGRLGLCETQAKSGTASVVRSWDDEVKGSLSKSESNAAAAAESKGRKGESRRVAEGDSEQRAKRFVRRWHWHANTHQIPHKTPTPLRHVACKWSLIGFHITACSPADFRIAVVPRLCARRARRARYHSQGARNVFPLSSFVGRPAPLPRRKRRKQARGFRCQ